MDFIHDIPFEEYKKLSHFYWLAVIGSREYNNYNTISDNIDYLIDALVHYKHITKHTDVLIVSGKAIGVDKRAKEYADNNGLKNVNILPDWDLFGYSAGMKRNPNIIKHARRVLAFQLNESGGTQGGIDYARKLKIPCNVIKLIG
jgi:hypothetical protein